MAFLCAYGHPTFQLDSSSASLLTLGGKKSVQANSASEPRERMPTMGPEMLHHRTTQKPWATPVPVCFAIASPREGCRTPPECRRRVAGHASWARAKHAQRLWRQSAEPGGFERRLWRHWLRLCLLRRAVRPAPKGLSCVVVFQRGLPGPAGTWGCGGSGRGAGRDGRAGTVQMMNSGFGWACSMTSEDVDKCWLASALCGRGGGVVELPP
ncbi:hypothetical protein B0T10DRAFT_62961 [Thelonectria olida]|uniref:Uncharacterized protein n=1 Tax=Thelonectria olida TaxID=1576542 RepID=A0A9P9AND4_9HYPO|nr:hypothetical protein B0T10DRAFT_62961 [Thelonectria olida]